MKATLLCERCGEPYHIKQTDYGELVMFRCERCGFKNEVEVIE